MMAVAFPKPLRSRLPDQVAVALLRSIVSGEIGEGKQLPTEVDLGARFGVSRTVVREAIRMLVSRGLVAVHHGKGMWVAPAASWDPLDTDVMRVRFERGEFNEVWRQFLEARRIVEVEAARLAATRRTAADLDALVSALDQMREAAGDKVRYRQADVTFHWSLVRAGQNPVLQRLLEPLHTLLVAGGLRAPSGAVDRALADHERVLAALNAQDGDRAAEAMRRLFPETLDAERELFEL